MNRDLKQAILVLLLCPSLVYGQLTETRYCGEPRRDARGHIVRRSDVMLAFQKIHPCPSTGLPYGACPSWAKDHVIPLACGGCDAVPNMQWLPDSIKSAAGAFPKDRWERKVYALPESPMSRTDACILALPIK